MGQDEKDLLLGKAVRERQAARAEIAIIDQELSRFRDGMEAVLGTRELRKGPYFSSHPAPPFVVPEEVKKYADLSKLVELLNHKSELDRKREELDTTIKVCAGE